MNRLRQRVKALCNQFHPGAQRHLKLTLHTDVFIEPAAGLKPLPCKRVEVFPFPPLRCLRRGVSCFHGAAGSASRLNLTRDEQIAPMGDDTLAA